MKIINLLLLLAFITSCKKTDPTQATTCDPLISYQAKVKPIFVASCTATGCHDGVDLPSLADYLTARDASKQIRSAVANGQMPLYSTMPAADKSAIICWIDSGSKKN